MKRFISFTGKLTPQVTPVKERYHATAPRRAGGRAGGAERQPPVPNRWLPEPTAETAQPRARQDTVRPGVWRTYSGGPGRTAEPVARCRAP